MNPTLDKRAFLFLDRQDGGEKSLDDVCGKLPAWPSEEGIAAVRGPGKIEKKIGTAVFGELPGQALAVNDSDQLIAPAMDEQRGRARAVDQTDGRGSRINGGDRGRRSAQIGF